MITHIFFDFDGTLVDSFSFHVREINSFFKDVQMTETEFREMHVGNFYASQPDRLKGLDWERYARHVAAHEQTLPLNTTLGLLLPELHTARTLGIVSSGFEEQIRPFLLLHHIDALFQYTLFRNNTASKYDAFMSLQNRGVPLETSVYITDTCGDVHEAARAGLATIAVTFGFHTKEMLMSAQPTRIIESWSQLQQVLEELGSEDQARVS